jgi:hypothetical protein
MPSASAFSVSLEKLLAINRSPIPALVAFALFLPVWGATRIGAWKSSLNENQFMDSSEIFLGAAAAPLDRFPWYYDGKERLRFLRRGDLYAEWPITHRANPDWVHIPPWEPGLALPLAIAYRVFALPPSMAVLAGIQIGIDVGVLALIGVIGSWIGGSVAAAAGMLAYARWWEPARAAALPFYYYWPIPFGLLLVSLFAPMGGAGRRRWWLAPLGAGLVLGLWCWFRGTAVPLALVLPLAILIRMGWQRRTLTAVGLAALGIAVALAPSAYHNLRRTGGILPRGQIWHDLYVGLGTRPNPYGIEHRDSAAWELTQRKYGVPFHSPQYEAVLRRAYLSILSTNPRLILGNFVANFEESLCGSPFEAHFPYAKWLWVPGVCGIAVLLLRRDTHATLLIVAYIFWLSQCTILSIAMRPQSSYLWETMGLALLCAAAGLGAVVEALLVFVSRGLRYRPPTA